MTLKTRIKQLEEEQAAQESHMYRCIYEIVWLTIGEEPTPKQQTTLARNATCRADQRDAGFSVVETPPMPDWMKGGVQCPPREIKD